ncbi:MAG: IreB family regulatory phosphoprotein [Lachnospiraceae bacterium]|nr:IreB family regulatory phosphoprotein [Lachnospiraceae bacterium]
MGDNNISRTQFFKVEMEQVDSVKMILEEVFDALSEKGYNPVNQIVGYIMSGDPTYITSHKNARSIIMKAERDELVEELLTEYIKNNGWAMEEDEDE